MDGEYSMRKSCETAYRILAGKPEGKASLGVRKWENSNKLDLKEIRCQNWRGFICLAIGTSDKLLWTL
jgi:hypothetical protein